MSVSDSESARAISAHEEYLAEARRLIDDEVKALFAVLSAAIAGTTGAGPGAGSIGVSQDERSFTATNGGRSVTFSVEAVTDLPEGADKAKEFPAGQARCTVSGPDGVIATWVLHRIGAGDAVRYTWMQANTEKPISDQDVAAALQPLSV